MKQKYGKVVAGEVAVRKPTKDQETVKRHYLKGIAYYVNGKLDKAISEWEQVLRIDPDNIQARNNLEKCKRKMGM